MTNKPDNPPTPSSATTPAVNLGAPNLAASNQATSSPAAPVPAKPPQFKLLHLPGIMSIGAYMLLLAVTVVVGVSNGHFPAFFLALPVLFIAAGLGLLLLLRWAWALTLAAVAMLAGLFLWSYSTEHSYPSLAQGLLNLIIFLYLVRTDIREKLR